MSDLYADKFKIFVSANSNCSCCYHHEDKLQYFFTRTNCTCSFYSKWYNLNSGLYGNGNVTEKIIKKYIHNPLSASGRVLNFIKVQNILSCIWSLLTTFYWWVDNYIVMHVRYYLHVTVHYNSGNSGINVSLNLTITGPFDNRFQFQHSNMNIFTPWKQKQIYFVRKVFQET